MRTSIVSFGTIQIISVSFTTKLTLSHAWSHKRSRASFGI